MDRHELLRAAERLRKQCKAQRENATRLREEAAAAMAAAAQAMERSRRLYEGRHEPIGRPSDDGVRAPSPNLGLRPRT